MSLSLGPVAARAIHRRPVKLGKRLLMRASVIPYFDSVGVARTVMVVWPASPRIAFLRLAPDLVQVPWLSAVKIAAAFDQARDVDAEEAASLTAGCWHWDPWWVLEAKRFAHHPAVPVLKATNCADRFRQPVRECYFARDLTHLVSVDVKGVVGRVPYTPDLLPEIPAPASPARRHRGWRLDPFWLRKPRRHCDAGRIVL